jgi:hypothetical protein
VRSRRGGDRGGKRPSRGGGDRGEEWPEWRDIPELHLVIGAGGVEEPAASSRSSSRLMRHCSMRCTLPERSREGVARPALLDLRPSSWHKGEAAKMGECLPDPGGVEKEGRFVVVVEQRSRR